MVCVLVSYYFRIEIVNYEFTLYNLINIPGYVIWFALVLLLQQLGAAIVLKLCSATDAPLWNQTLGGLEVGSERT